MKKSGLASAEGTLSRSEMKMIMAGLASDEESSFPDIIRCTGYRCDYRFGSSSGNICAFGWSAVRAGIEQICGGTGYQLIPMC